MILDGYSIVDRSIVILDTENEFNTEDQVQPNGVDLRAAAIYEVQGNVVIPRDSKALADLRVQSVELKEGYWTLSPRPGVLYYVDFLEKIVVPGGFCGIIHTRSSLIRSGIDVVAGLYDAGFQGQLGGTLRVHSNVTIEYGAKLAQVTIHQSLFRGKLYTGRYQHTNSQTAIHGT